MNFEQTIQLIKTEFGRNKAKTLALLAVFCVAIYMWAPRLMGLLGGGGEDTIVTADADTENNGQQNSTTGESDTTNRILMRAWDQLLAWREADPRMKSVALTETPNPFRRQASRLASEEMDERLDLASTAEPPAPPEEEEVDVAQLLIVTNTIVGRRGRWTTINGRRYQEHQTVTVGGEAAAEAAATPFEFQLDEIHTDYVLVSRDGQQHRLALNKEWTAMSDRVSVRRVATER